MKKAETEDSWPSGVTYAELLRNPRWQRRKSEMLNAANWRCEDCGRKDKTLEVHHTAYIKGLTPWKYPDELLMVCCETCHDKRQQLEDGFRTAIGKITRFLSPSELEQTVWDLLKTAHVRQMEHYERAFSCE